MIHAVGPVWSGGGHHEKEQLASAYRRCLGLCRERQLESIAFPNISTGVYGFPKELAAEIAIREVQTFLDGNILPEKVIFCVFDEENFEIYKRKLSQDK